MGRAPSGNADHARYHPAAAAGIGSRRHLRLSIMACGVIRAAPDSAGGFARVGEQVAFSFLPPAVGANVRRNGALRPRRSCDRQHRSSVADGRPTNSIAVPCWLSAHWRAALVASIDSSHPQSYGGILGVLVLWGGISFGICRRIWLLGHKDSGGGDIARANAAFTIMYTVAGLAG